MVHATSEALGLRAMTNDYNDGLDPWLYVDASAAIGVAQRTGLGKIRHLDTGSLWPQQAVKNGKVGILKIKGTENPSDLMTKFTDLATLDKLCGIMGLLVREGRAAAAPGVAKHAAPAGNETGGTDKTEEVCAIEECEENVIHEQSPWGGSPGDTDPVGSAMEATPVLSPAGSLPPADVAAVEAQPQSDGPCTVHELEELSFEGQRAQENSTRRRHKQLRRLKRQELFEDYWEKQEVEVSGLREVLGIAMKKEHFAQCKVAQRIGETKSTSMRRKATVHDLLGGASNFVGPCTRARWILSQGHGQSYEVTTPLLDSCASLEGKGEAATCSVPLESIVTPNSFSAHVEGRCAFTHLI